MNVVCQFPEPTTPHPAFVAAQNEAIIWSLERAGIDPSAVFPDRLATLAPHPPYYERLTELRDWERKVEAGWRAGLELLEQVFKGAETITRRRGERKAA